MCPFCFPGYSYRMVTTASLYWAPSCWQWHFHAPSFMFSTMQSFCCFNPRTPAPRWSLHDTDSPVSLTGARMVPSVPLCEHGLQVHWHSLCLLFYVVYIIQIQSAEFSFSVSRTHHRYSAIPPPLLPFWLNQKLRSKKTKNCQPMACMEQGCLSLIFKSGSWPLNYVRVTFT